MEIRGHLYRTSSGKLVIDKCLSDAEHAAASPEAYDPNNVTNWRRRCRVEIDDLFSEFVGKEVEIERYCNDDEDIATIHLRVRS